MMHVSETRSIPRHCCLLGRRFRCHWNNSWFAGSCLASSFGSSTKNVSLPMNCKKKTLETCSVSDMDHTEADSQNHICNQHVKGAQAPVAGMLQMLWMPTWPWGFSSRLLMATALHKGLKMTCQSSANTGKLDYSAWFEMSSLAWDAHGNMFSQDCLLSGLQWLIFQFFKQDKSHFCPNSN